MPIQQTSSIYISNNIKESATNYQKNIEALSSGNKYQKLADNPAVVAEATKLNIQINGNKIIQSNIGVGNDMLTLTDGYQESITNCIDRIKDLTLQISNGTWTDQEKEETFNEIKAQLSSINDIANSAQYNGTKLLDGTASNVILRIGSSATDVLKLDPVLINETTSGLDINIAATKASDWDDASIKDYLSKLDTASQTLTTNSANIGALSTKLDSISNTVGTNNITLQNYKSDISDVDTAEESANMIKNQILEQASVNIFLQNSSIFEMRTQLFVGK